MEEEEQLRREVRQQQLEFENEKWQYELALHEEDLRIQQEHDDLNYGAMREMQASRAAQEWDDWVIWDAMRNPPPPPKKQRLVTHVRLEAENVIQERFGLITTPGAPVTMGLTWSIAEDDNPEPVSTPARTSAATQMMTPPRVTFEAGERGKGSRSLIAIDDLSELLLSAEGTSVFGAWKTGGFQDQQIRELYGERVLESFIAHRLMDSQETEITAGH